jgi:integrase
MVVKHYIRHPETTRPTKRRREFDRLLLRPGEMRRLFKLIESLRDQAIFLLAYHVGLRASEVAMLDMRDYDTRPTQSMSTGTWARTRESIA